MILLSPLCLSGPAKDLGATRRDNCSSLEGLHVQTLFCPELLCSPFCTVILFSALTEGFGRAGVCSVAPGKATGSTCESQEQLGT